MILRSPRESSRIAGEPRQLPIAAIVLTFNEAVNIDECLKTVAGWCREIYVVDSGSTDATLEICRKYTDRIHNHAFIDSASQWNWAFQNLPVQSPWTFVLDADHRVEPGLWLEIAKALESDDSETAGYYSRHRYMFWGQRIRGFKPYGLRIVRSGSARADSSELVDMRFIVQGKLQTLSGFVVEDNQKELEIDFWIDKHQRFASRMAIEQLLRSRQKLGWAIEPSLFGSHDQRIIWLKNLWYGMPLYVRPFAYFFYRYILRLGVLDGSKGAVFHFLHAFWFRLLIDLHIGQLEAQLVRGNLSIEELERLGRPANA